jgi:hypothetical protein
VAKVRREERYHVMHMDVWLRRLAEGGDEARSRLEAALERLVPDAPSVLATLDDEETLTSARILSDHMSDLAQSWAVQANARLSGLGFSFGDLCVEVGRTRSVGAVGSLQVAVGRVHLRLSVGGRRDVVAPTMARSAARVGVWAALHDVPRSGDPDDFGRRPGCGWAPSRPSLGGFASSCCRPSLAARRSR